MTVDQEPPYAGMGLGEVRAVLRGVDGALIVNGWTAWRYEPGSHLKRRWHDPYLPAVELALRLA